MDLLLNCLLLLAAGVQHALQGTLQRAANFAQLAGLAGLAEKIEDQKPMTSLIGHC
jgi:hypothetical protein